MVGDRIMPDRRAVIAAKPIAPIIARTALLRESRFRLKCAEVRLDAKIAPTDINFYWLRNRIADGCCFAFDDAAEQAVGAVDPIVETEAEAVDARLIVA